jgi:hypothetical protein
MTIALEVYLALTEYPGLGMGIYEYYGSQPFKLFGFPLYWSFVNSTALFSVGVALHFLWPLVKDEGWKRLAVIPMAPVVMSAGMYGSGFPVFLIINSDVPTWVEWLVGLLTVGIATAWVKTLAAIVSRESVPTFSLWAVFKAQLNPFKRTSPPDDAGPHAEGEIGISGSTMPATR